MIRPARNGELQITSGPTGSYEVEPIADRRGHSDSMIRAIATKKTEGLERMCAEELCGAAVTDRSPWNGDSLLDASG